jgi:uncharacterized protein YgbK (DUF1537 family)
MKPPIQPQLKIAYYGDDFTGATDTLATAARAGLRTMLFLGLPADDHLMRTGPLDCIGIAGAARAMAPAEMQHELEPVGRLFNALGAPVIHYKTCSTFDSAPHVGSIGAAIRVLKRHVRNPFVPIVGGQPNLRRYCLFGNLFAGAGSDGAVCRIDRHPTMRAHPVTPMHEAELPLHFAQQGLARVASLDYTAYDEMDEALDRRLEAMLAQQPDAVLMDIGQASHLAVAGRLIWQHAQRAPLLAAGPSSVVQALAAHWHAGRDAAASPATAPAQGPVLLLAGSLSPVTARQVEAARSYGKVAIDASRLLQDANYAGQLAHAMATLLRAGRHVLACTSLEKDGAARHRDGRRLAIACGTLLARVLQHAPVKRVGIAGGDTSSYAVQAMNGWGLSYQSQLAPGVALCRLHSNERMLDGMEIMLKGGQMGTDDLFERLLQGTH